jgi:hypothetical protein
MFTPPFILISIWLLAQKMNKTQEVSPDQLMATECYCAINIEAVLNLPVFKQLPAKSLLKILKMVNKGVGNLIGSVKISPDQLLRVRNGAVCDPGLVTQGGNKVGLKLAPGGILELWVETPRLGEYDLHLKSSGQFPSDAEDLWERKRGGFTGSKFGLCLHTKSMVANTAFTLAMGPTPLDTIVRAILAWLPTSIPEPPQTNTLLKAFSVLVDMDKVVGEPFLTLSPREARLLRGWLVQYIVHGFWFIHDQPSLFLPLSSSTMAEILGHDDLYTKKREHLVLRVCVQWARAKDKLAQEVAGPATEAKPGSAAFPGLVQFVRFPYIPSCASTVRIALTVRFLFFFIVYRPLKKHLLILVTGRRAGLRHVVRCGTQVVEECALFAARNH